MVRSLHRTSLAMQIDDEMLFKMPFGYHAHTKDSLRYWRS